MSEEYRADRFAKTREKQRQSPYKPRSPRKQANIPHRTKKRLDQEIEYKKLCVKMDREARESGKVYCFFCDKEIEGFISHHHLDGRDGDDLLNEEFIMFSHNKCHVEDYHSKSIKQLRKLGWYDGFLERLKVVSEELYNKELKKEDKT